MKNKEQKWTKTRKREKEKILGAYNKQYKQRCHKCGRYSHKPGDCKCLENKKENYNKEKTEKKITKKIKISLVYAIIVDKKGIGVLNAESRYKKKNEKAKKAVDWED